MHSTTFSGRISNKSKLRCVPIAIEATIVPADKEVLLKMTEYVKANEKALGDLMAEYWSLRHDVGEQIDGRLRVFSR